MSQQNTNQSTTPTPSPITTATLSSPTPTAINQGFSCSAQDQSICETAGTIKLLIDNGEVNKLPDYFSLREVECPDPNAPSIELCNGKPIGLLVQGYEIGYNASEGDVLTKESFISTMQTYMAQKDPFIFQTFESNENDTVSVGTLHYLSSDRKSMLDVNLRKFDGIWKIQNLLIGVSNEYLDNPN